jgi:hypothetical protein
MAFHNHRGGRPLCPSIIARNIATLIAAELHAPERPRNMVGQPRIYHTHTIHTHHHRRRRLPNSHPTIHMRQPHPTKLIPLWEHNMLKWEQIARLSPTKRPYLLSDKEILWANPHLRKRIPNTLQKAILYLRRLLQADSPEHLPSLTLTLSKPNPRFTLLAKRWLGLLGITLDTLPLGPTPLQLLPSAKHQDITISFKKWQNVQG